ncbi:hypothetical protein JW835_03105 [bacterium]|nr:hypothetical protein [bacterium]
MKNPYKRLDVFRCSQDAHKRFQGRVSVYHVLKEKGCYPQGCLYFLWRCSRFEKGESCIHKYHYVGKNCKGCTYYMEEKVHLQPTCLLSEADYTDFLEDLENFETWLDAVRFKRLPIAGRIQIVKPWFERSIYNHENHVKLRGYLLIFKRGFIGMDVFEDTFYVRISDRLMQTYRFIPKMKVEMSGEVREDRGRIVIHKPGTIEILTKGWGKRWQKDKALVAIRTATLLPDQPENCINCPWGALTDTTDLSKNPPQHFRNLFCIKGIADPDYCYMRANKKAGLSCTQT